MKTEAYRTTLSGSFPKRNPEPMEAPDHGMDPPPSQIGRAVRDVYDVPATGRPMPSSTGTNLAIRRTARSSWKRSCSTAGYGRL
jgi:hypothetical protein